MPRRGRKKSRGIQRVELVKSDPALPPLATPIVLKNLHFRFQCTGNASSSTITQADILGLLCVFQNMSTTGVRMFGAARVKRVLMQDLSLANKISILWLGSQTTGAAFQSEKQLMSVGTSFQPARIDSTPPAGSAAGMWFGSATSTNLFELFPAGEDTFVDLWIDAQVNYATGTITSNTSAPSAGAWNLPLDGPGVSPNFPSVVAGGSLS